MLTSVGPRSIVSDQVDQCVALDHLQEPDVNGEEQDTESGRADEGMVAVDQKGDVEHIHNVLVHSLSQKRKRFSRKLESIGRSIVPLVLKNLFGCYRVSGAASKGPDAHSAIGRLNRHSVECVL